MSKILIVHASFGEGHKQAAHALKEHLGAECRDLLDFTFPFLKKFYIFNYLIVTQHICWLWGALFFIARVRFISSIIDKAHRLIFSSFFKYLRENKPKVIVTTHFFPSSLIAALKEELGVKVITIITDLRVHPWWVNGCIDYYFVALDATKKDLVELGVDERKILSGYVSLREGFLKKVSLESVYQKFSLKPGPSVLFVSSLRGSFPHFKKSIEEILKKFNIFLIYGKNKKLESHLKKMDTCCIRFFYFYNEIWELMAASSVLVTKPGGLTVFEGVFMKKFFIFTHYIPGQEKGNMDLLIKSGVARFAKNSKELLESLDYFNEKRKISQDYPLKVKDIRKPLTDLVNSLINV